MLPIRAAMTRNTRRVASIPGCISVILISHHHSNGAYRSTASLLVGRWRRPFASITCKTIAPTNDAGAALCSDANRRRPKPSAAKPNRDRGCGGASISRFVLHFLIREFFFSRCSHGSRIRAPLVTLVLGPVGPQPPAPGARNGRCCIGPPQTLRAERCDTPNDRARESQPPARCGPRRVFLR